MDNNSDDQFLTMQSTIDANRQDFDKKMKKLTEYLISMIASMTE